MGSRQILLEKMQQRENYRNIWHTDLLGATSTDFPYCCFATWCGPCASYLLRKRALNNDLTRYTCCAGYLPCSGHCGESNCPEFCLCTEVLCCFANSVQSTRFMLQDEYNLQNTSCDNFIIAFMFCLQQVACIFGLIAAIIGSDELTEIANIIYCISDSVYCAVCGCMQTQHKVEMDKWEGKFGQVERPMQPPGPQQMSRIDQPIPPTVGYTPAYPPPPVYGQPVYAQPYPPPAYAPGPYQPPPGPPGSYASR
ncbi:hypothetical protein O6H91_12G030600 [Diphasiastrum complanatum]|uniref:Uncharacterized protein n=1 Tax=Diphasiastrum complanatum TaxID=34168 RepID=A0ACC2C056_DIPCM|nr:hypothetical protein O6H91_12G030600 [Diphasiastrum complanatum]